jgi:hypothetical protein
VALERGLVNRVTETTHTQNTAGYYHFRHQAPWLFRDENSPLTLLHPIMPASNGVLSPELQRRAEAQNSSCAGLDWEIEDILPEDLIRGFCNGNPGALIRGRRSQATCITSSLG